MGVRFPSVQSNTLVNGTIVTTAETVIVTSPAFTPPLDSAVIYITGVVCINAVGTTASQAVVRIRRGTTIAAAQVNIGGAFPVTPAAQAYSVIWYFDQPAAVSGQQYSITLQMTGATANTTLSDAAISVVAL